MASVLTSPADQLYWAARVALKAASKDNITPVLTGVYFRVEDGSATLTATDRYRVHQAAIPAKDAPDGEFLMDRHQVEWMLRSVHRPARLYRDQLVRITWEGGALAPGQSPEARSPRRTAATIQVDVLGHNADDAPVFSYKAHGIPGDFPSVTRLFPDLKSDDELLSEFGFSPQLVADLRVLSHPGSPDPLKFYTPRAGEARRGIGKPFLVTNLEGDARALIQPTLLLR